MKEKTLHTIVAFHTTTDALAMEAYCTQHAIPGRLIPLPTIISAGCGMCWSASNDVKEIEAIQKGLQTIGIQTAGIYQMML